MKRFIALFAACVLTVALVAGCLNTNAPSPEAVTPDDTGITTRGGCEVTPTASYAPALFGADTVVVVISFGNYDDDVAAVGMDMTYDDNVLNYLGHTVLWGNWDAENAYDHGGWVRWGAFMDPPETPNSTSEDIVEFRFIVDNADKCGDSLPFQMDDLVDDIERCTPEDDELACP
jgi:hypothetical protein